MYGYSLSRGIWIQILRRKPKVKSTLIDAGAQKLLVNFENLDYISSAGLRILLATAKKLKASQGDLKICWLNETVQEVFDISGFATILSVSKTEEEALGAF